jgi:hypothetical protein
VSRGRDARRKAKRREAQAFTATTSERGRAASLRLAIPIAMIVIVPILATIGISGIGSNHRRERKQVSQEVTALLAGIPQSGTTLGSSKAPITLRLYTDLECLDVKHFAIANLPSIINTWVRSGTIKLEYRSLRTDTRSQATFARQETAAFATGRQNKLWNFALTFIYEQGEQYTDYVTETFLIGIASQVRGLDMAQWRQDRADPRLSNYVAISDISARSDGLVTTPSFLIGLTGSKIDQLVGSRTAASFFVDAAYLQRYVQSLNQ